MHDQLNAIPIRQLIPTMARVWRRRLDGVLIHGHMRSGSTLLVHLLCQHPTIAGIGETHAGYRSGRDIARLVYRIEAVQKARLPYATRWVIDKLLHDLPLDIAALPRATHHLFIVREPRAAIASMMKPDFALIETNAQAEAYYCQRMRTLLDLQHRVKDLGLPSHACLYETLVNDSQRALTDLGHWLDLEPPLKPTYNLLPTAGEPGFGDRSTVLKAGRIVSPDATRDPAPRPACSDEAQRLFDRFREDAES